MKIDTPVELIGTRDPVVANPGTHLLSIVDRMENNDIGRIPIVDEEGCLVGIVTRSDVLKAYDHIPTKLRR
ncbi:MAG: hypothetical protein MAG715_01240 [Methanonatronarchaeales archaeon]|nr:hypothetical protein [Methanonatronarchaeales archaeon]